jgi:hypothetical protein
MKIHRSSLLLGALLGAFLTYAIGLSNQYLMGILAIVALVDLLSAGFINNRNPTKKGTEDE